MKRRTTISLIAAMLAGTLFSATANALDRVYPGNMCQPNLGSQASDFRRDARSILNVNHTDVNNRTVTCPIIRDLTVGNDLAKRVTIHVERHSGSTGLFHCYLDNMNAQGDWTNYSYGTYSGSGKHEMVIELYPAPGTLYQSLSCSLPRDSELHYYRTREWLVK